MSPAWLYYNGAQAGLDRQVIATWPIGQVLDQIACYQIAKCGAKEVTKPKGGLGDQMRHYYGR